MALATPAKLSISRISGNSNATPNSRIMLVTNEMYRVTSSVVLMSVAGDVQQELQALGDHEVGQHRAGGEQRRGERDEDVGVRAARAGAGPAR